MSCLRVFVVVFLGLAVTRARAEAPAFDTLFGLHVGATAYDLERALGTPDAIVPGDDPVLRFAIHPVDPGESLPASLEVTVCGDTGRVCGFTVDVLEAGRHFAARAPVLGLLGMDRAELRARLGPPTQEDARNLTWRVQAAGGTEATLALAVGSDDRARRLDIAWLVPTRPPPSRVRGTDFRHFAGLAHGDREEHVLAVFGPPSSVRLDTREYQRRLEYDGIAVGIDRGTGLIAYLAFGPKAEAFLASRGLDEPGLWVLGKSPAFLRRLLGRAPDTETWAWPSTRAPAVQLAASCGIGVVPSCEAAVLSWFVTTRAAPLPKLAAADFLRFGPLAHGDTEVALRQKLGEPSKVLERGAERELSYDEGGLTVLLDASGRIGGLRAERATGPWLAERGHPDPHLALLGRKRADVVRALGRPNVESSAENPTWVSSLTGAVPRVIVTLQCYDFDQGRCNSLAIIW